LDLRYVVLGCRALAETGSGRSIELSSAGLSFTAENRCRSDRRFNVSIDWPVSPDGEYHFN
jgi:hypothetical protein